MDSLYKLKKIEAKFKKCTISHDMTKKDREECKSLVSEAKEKKRLDTSGEWMYQVRGLPSQVGPQEMFIIAFYVDIVIIFFKLYEFLIYQKVHQP